jgi:hypothetical protein
MPQHRYDEPGAAGLPPADVAVIDDAETLADMSSLDESKAANVLYLLKTRHENRGEDRYDVVVVFDDWAYQDWSDYDVANNQVALVGSIDDHSEDAYSFRGGFEVVDEIAEQPLDDLKDEYITDAIEQIDQTGDDGFADRLAAGYWPKSAVEMVFVYDA